MELKLDTLDTLRYPPPIGVELNSKKFFTKRTLRSPLTEKKFGISIPSPNREFNPIQSEGSEGFVTYRSSRFFSIHAGKVKFLRGDVEWTGVDWQTLFFFYRIKVDASRFQSASSHPEKLKL